MTKSDAYKIVLEDLKQVGLFTGHYDAINGNKSFMYGISTVMEEIAYKVDEETGRNFTDWFTGNMIASQAKGVE